MDELTNIGSWLEFYDEVEYRWYDAYAVYYCNYARYCDMSICLCLN